MDYKWRTIYKWFIGYWPLTVRKNDLNVVSLLDGKISHDIKVGEEIYSVGSFEQYEALYDEIKPYLTDRR